MPNNTVRIGSRGSELALWQASWVQRELEKHHPGLTATVRVISTKGDHILDAPLAKIGDKGLFTREIEQALLDGEIDLAVHSLKDLPTTLPAGLALGAVTEREDVRDVFIPHPANEVRTLLHQPEGAVVATGSLRRTSQLLHLRPDLRVVDLRGNLNTRLKKLDASDWAGIILARAGVVRLGWQERIGEALPADLVLPAVGQGALGVEIRAEDTAVARLILPLHHDESAAATAAERALLRRLEGGCQVPIGTYGRVVHETGHPPVLVLDAVVGSLDGVTVVRGSIRGPQGDAESLGSRLAETLLGRGADRILAGIRA